MDRLGAHRAGSGWGGGGHEREVERGATCARWCQKAATHVADERVDMDRTPDPCMPVGSKLYG
jgi:hypothetical protein